MKEPRHDFRAGEEEYFRKQEAELIARLKEEKAEKARHMENAAHRNHCTACGHETTVIHDKLDLGPSSKRGIEAWIGSHICLHCHQVSMSFATLQKLMFNKDARLLCQDIHDHLLRNHPKNSKGSGQSDGNPHHPGRKSA